MPSSTSPSVTSSPFGLVSRTLALLRWDRADLATTDTTSHRGPKRKIENWQIQVALIIHMVQPHGTLAMCVWQYLGLKISDVCLSLRRRKMTLQPFLTIMRTALQPLAQETLHSACFFAGLRLVGHDGTTLSVANTAAVLAEMPKAKTRKGLAAFAKVGLGVLVELGTHNPLAAAISVSGESESVLFARTLVELPERCLLILDRWYGNAPMLQAVQQRCEATSGAFLIRVKDKLAATVQRKYADGSADVAVALHDPDKYHKVLKQLVVREVRAKLQRRQDGQWIEVRLWTSLSVEQASAEQIVALYAKRWEQEVFYKELKMGLRKGDLLLSQTPETAVQETVALLLAASLIAEERLACAEQSQEGEVQESAVMRISYGWCVQLTTALWIMLACSEGLMDAATQAELVRRTRQQIAELALPKRRQRTCDRKVRQPVQKWPRMIHPISVTGDLPVFIQPIT